MLHYVLNYENIDSVRKVDKSDPSRGSNFDNFSKLKVPPQYYYDISRDRLSYLTILKLRN